MDKLNCKQFNCINHGGCNIGCKLNNPLIINLDKSNTWGCYDEKYHAEKSKIDLRKKLEIIPNWVTGLKFK
jgi:hypothetical protein